MGFFDFLKDKKINENNFIGRNQQILTIKNFLGETISELDLQIAKNKDSGEYKEIEAEIKKIEDYIQSEFFTTKLDVLQSYEKIKEILEKGYEKCVLQNNTELETRALNIINQSINYVKNLPQTSQEQIDILDNIIGNQKVLGFLSYIDLGGLLVAADEQMTWTILSYRVPEVISVLPEKEVLIYTKNLKEFVEKMIEKHSKIESKYSKNWLVKLNDVDKEIKKGMELNDIYFKK